MSANFDEKQPARYGGAGNGRQLKLNEISTNQAFVRSDMIDSADALNKKKDKTSKSAERTGPGVEIATFGAKPDTTTNKG